MQPQSLQTKQKLIECRSAFLHNRVVWFISSSCAAPDGQQLSIAHSCLPATLAPLHTGRLHSRTVQLPFLVLYTSAVTMFIVIGRSTTSQRCIWCALSPPTSFSTPYLLPPPSTSVIATTTLVMDLQCILYKIIAGNVMTYLCMNELLFTHSIEYSNYHINLPDHGATAHQIARYLPVGSNRFIQPDYICLVSYTECIWYEESKLVTTFFGFPEKVSTTLCCRIYKENCFWDLPLHHGGLAVVHQHSSNSIQTVIYIFFVLIIPVGAKMPRVSTCTKCF